MTNSFVLCPDALLFVDVLSGVERLDLPYHSEVDLLAPEPLAPMDRAFGSDHVW
ncbi:hypothetical protein [Chondromyces crocatus]|uniref:Uncharacterized protein n=1 Tax=Chondromyces crocatus TaxID=52 RepID=A0A0K1EIQ3_CHOCO|nr:hypothetical protein [Chondromyces crocatus]AKT40739.1 uncharacterized protein CMC5_048950 [Chondromyces crocatus]